MMVRTAAGKQSSQTMDTAIKEKIADAQAALQRASAGKFLTYLDGLRAAFHLIEVCGNLINIVEQQQAQIERLPSETSPLNPTSRPQGQSGAPQET